jgi:hypothetical protein
MKTLFSFIVAALFLTAIPQHAFAQQAPGSGPGPAVQGGKPAETFTERKAHILTMLEDRKTRIEKEKACVEAAKDNDDLKKCRPERPMGMGQGGMQQGRSGQQRPPMTPAEHSQ